MEKFKVGDWEETNTSNVAYSKFIKGQKITESIKTAFNTKKNNIKKSKGKSKKTNQERNKVVVKKVELNKPIVKAKAMLNKSKKYTTEILKTKTSTDIPKKTLKQPKNKKNNKKPPDNPPDSITPVVFNRKTINNPILTSRKHSKGKSLRERMIERLDAARFRFLNEEIYIQNGKSAETMFKNDPQAFNIYHTGYRQQVNKWPVNPLDVIIDDVKKMPKTVLIADLGCGEAKLSKSVSQKVHSFDLVALNDEVTVCNMASTPLAVNSMDVVVFCLSLMGTNLHDYVKEANRVLKTGGLMKIAEVESRFDEVATFVKGVEHFGFKKLKMNFSNNLFYFFDFKKVARCTEGAKKSTLMLKPCLYKKR